MSAPSLHIESTDSMIISCMPYERAVNGRPIVVYLVMILHQELTQSLITVKLFDRTIQLHDHCFLFGNVFTLSPNFA